MFLQMGQFGPHPHCSAFGSAAALGVGCSWDSIFMGGLELVTITVLLVGGIDQSFSFQRGSLTSSCLRQWSASVNWDLF